MSMSSYLLTPGIDQKQETARRKIAYALMMQGSSGEPVQHWAQGLARLGQGALGGYEAYQEDEKDREREDKVSKALDNVPGMGAPPAAEAPQASPRITGALGGAGAIANPMGAASDPGAPIAAPRAVPVQPSAKVWGDDEAVAAGLYEPTVKDRFAAVGGGTATDARPIQTQRITQALSPQQAPASPQAAPTIRPPVIPPEAQAEIRELWKNPATRAIALQKLDQYSKPKDQVVPVTDPAERSRYGIGPDDKTPYQKDATGKISPINPQPFQVNVNQQGESEFSKETAKLQAKRFDELAGEAMTAKQMQSDVAMLRHFGEKIRTGKGAEVRATIGPYAEALGIKVEGLSDIQAFEAIVNRVAPNMRVKGTGAQSDFELKNFFKQFPSIGGNPDGNALIDKTLNGFIENKIAASEIGSLALTGELTRKEAEKRLRELPDPMKEWREFNKKNPATSSAPQVIDGYTIREKK